MTLAPAHSPATARGVAQRSDSGMKSIPRLLDVEREVVLGGSSSTTSVNAASRPVDATREYVARLAPPRCPCHTRADSVARVGTPEFTRLLVAARGLVKRFGDFTAVDGIDFEIFAGESFGFLGPNGAGKTSTMKMVSCISPATEGELHGARHGPASATARRSARASASCPRRTRLSSS